MSWRLDVVGRPVRTLVLVSTAAHCLNDLLFRQRSENLPIDIVGVVGNHRDLEPLTEFYGKEFHHIPVSKDTKAEAEARLLALVRELDVEPRGARPVHADPLGRPVPRGSRARSSTSTTPSCRASRVRSRTTRRTTAA